MIKLNSILFLKRGKISSLNQSDATFSPQKKNADGNVNTIQELWIYYKKYNLGEPGSEKLITPTFVRPAGISKEPFSDS